MGIHSIQGANTKYSCTYKIALNREEPHLNELNKSVQIVTSPANIFKGCVSSQTASYQYPQNWFFPQKYFQMSLEDILRLRPNNFDNWDAIEVNEPSSYIICVDIYCITVYSDTLREHLLKMLSFGDCPNYLSPTHPPTKLFFNICMHWKFPLTLNLIVK